MADSQNNGSDPQKQAQASPRRCTGTTKAGKPCQSTALMAETGTCMAHAPEEVRESKGFGGSQPGAGRPRSPKVIEVLRQRIEEGIDEWLQPLTDGLSAERGVVVGDGAHARIEYVPDLPTRLKAFREGMDRAFGRPMQFHDVTTREEESEVDREIRELLSEMERRDAPAPSNGNGKVPH